MILFFALATVIMPAAILVSLIVFAIRNAVERSPRAVVTRTRDRPVTPIDDRE